MKKNHLIFVADDSEIFSYLLSTHLEENSAYSVKTFSDGREMLSHLYLLPSAIVLDYYFDSGNKQAMNGREVLYMMKIMGYNNIPVIMVTGASSKDLVPDLGALGVCSYISKKEEDLLNSIEYNIQMAVAV